MFSSPYIILKTIKIFDFTCILLPQIVYFSQIHDYISYILCFINSYKYEKFNSYS